MSEILNLNTSLLTYDDTDQGTTNNPMRRLSDWTRRFSNVVVSRAKSSSFVIDPGQSLLLFSGVRTTSIDGTTAFGMSLLSSSTSTYRFTNSAGAAPAFRTARALATSALSQVVVAINNNAVATFTVSIAGSFAAAQVGDILRIAGVATGDASGPFAAGNEGYWVVLSATASVLTCRRLAGAAFSGSAETVILGVTFATLFTVYSSAGVQIGDKVEISAGFSVVTQRTFTVSQVAPTFFEVVSADPLPLETGILPGAAGMVFYTAAKKVVYCEVDQEAVVRPNGYTGDLIRLSPFTPSDSSLVASYQQIGNIFSLTVVNKSDVNTLNLFVFTAE